MDPDTQALLTVTRGQLKAARRQMSTVARLLAQLDDRFGGLEEDGNPEKGHQDDDYDEIS